MQGRAQPFQVFHAEGIAAEHLVQHHRVHRAAVGIALQVQTGAEIGRGIEVRSKFQIEVGDPFGFEQVAAALLQASMHVRVPTQTGA